ncbi:MAG: hypothetical protein AAB938_00145 [Patescibacteria group bacterium]
MPKIVSAAVDSSIPGLVTRFKENIINPLLAILFSLALLYFLWGAAKFIWSAGDSKTQNEGKDHMIWGFVGMLVMISAYGIINIAGNLIGIPPRQ